MQQRGFKRPGDPNIAGLPVRKKQHTDIHMTCETTCQCCYCTISKQQFDVHPGTNLKFGLQQLVPFVANAWSTNTERLHIFVECLCLANSTTDRTSSGPIVMIDISLSVPDTQIIDLAENGVFKDTGGYTWTMTSNTKWCFQNDVVATMW